MLQKLRGKKPWEVRLHLDEATVRPGELEAYRETRSQVRSDLGTVLVERVAEDGPCLSGSKWCRETIGSQHQELAKGSSSAGYEPS